MGEKERIKQLLSRREDLEKILAESRIVEDVLSGRDAIIGPESMEQRNSSIQYFDPVAGAATVVPQRYQESRYLFKNASEHPDEYAKRLKMTPVFSETRSILQSRLGTMFKRPPTLEGLDDFKSNATAHGMLADEVIMKAAEFAQSGGFCGVLLDRESLPADVQGRPVSKGEVEARGLGRPIWALYPSSQILDWREDARGLVWVKLVEESCEQAAWDAPERYVKTVRVVDRVSISVFRVISPEDFDIGDGIPSKATLELGPVVPHDALDDSEQPCCPFRFLHPFPARDGIGRSVLGGSAEADITATRILSSLIWVLHIHGCPILSLLTNRKSEDIADIGVGSSTLVVLQAGNGANRPDEKMAYVTLDVGAVDKLMQMYETLTAKAREQSEKQSGAAIQGPREQTGISKAWTFKTGEERILFLLSVCLQSGFEWLMKLTARYSGVEPDSVKVTFPQSFDIEGPIETVELTEAALPLLEKYQQATTVKLLMKKLVSSLLEDVSIDDGDAIEKELDKILTMDMRPETMLDQAGGGQDPNAKDLKAQEPLEEKADENAAA